MQVARLGMIYALLAAAAAALAGIAHAQPGLAPSSDLKTANGVRNIMLPSWIASGVPDFITPSGGDASLVIRNAGLLHAAEWDAGMLLTTAVKYARSECDALQRVCVPLRLRAMRSRCLMRSAC